MYRAARSNADRKAEEVGVDPKEDRAGANNFRHPGNPPSPIKHVMSMYVVNFGCVYTSLAASLLSGCGMAATSLLARATAR